MKFIIIYEDDNRTLLFQSDDRSEVEKWFANVLDQIRQKGGEIQCRAQDVAWGTVEDHSWKITIYYDWEVEKLRNITV